MYRTILSLVSVLLCSIIIADAKEHIVITGNEDAFSLFSKANAIYEIWGEVELKGKTLTIPENSVVEIKGGCLKNGIIRLNNTEIVGNEAFENVTLSGVIKNDFISTQIYKHGEDLSNVLNNLLRIGANVIVEKGTYVVNNVTIPVHFAGKELRGNGYSHYDYKNALTTLLKSTKGQPMFKFEEGANYITISDLKLDGCRIGTRGFDAEKHGTWCSLNNVGVYNFTDVGIYSNALWKMSSIYCARNTTGVVMASDSSIDKSEISGGITGLKVVSGGNKITNMWVNACNGYCIHITPKNNKENCINNVITNGYFGTDGNTTCESIIKIEGNNAMKVQDVRIDNSYFILTSFIQGTPNVIDVSNSARVIISNAQVTTYCERPLQNRHIKNCINIKGSDYIQIVNSIFIGYSSPIIESDTTCNFVMITGNQFTLRKPYMNRSIPILNFASRYSTITNNYFNSNDPLVFGIKNIFNTTGIYSNYFNVNHSVLIEGNCSGDNNKRL